MLVLNIYMSKQKCFDSKGIATTHNLKINVVEEHLIRNLTSHDWLSLVCVESQLKNFKISRPQLSREFTNALALLSCSKHYKDHYYLINSSFFSQTIFL